MIRGANSASTAKVAKKMEAGSHRRTRVMLVVLCTATSPLLALRFQGKDMVLLLTERSSIEEEH